MTTVAEVVGATLAARGVRHVFGVVGSGNFHVTNALVAGGADFVAARHEGGAATMADAYARLTGSVGVLSVHQGCGLTNAVTGITEAAKSRTPLVILSGEATSPTSNFWIEQSALLAAVGARACRVDSPARAAAQTAAAYALARRERCPVLLNLPLDVQSAQVPVGAVTGEGAAGAAPVPGVSPGDSAAVPEAAIAELCERLRQAHRPVFLAGRGARDPAAAGAVAALGDDCGALLATSAVANGLFAGNPWAVGISGGFASPLAAELIEGADLVVAWGCSLGMWTTRHGRLIRPGTPVVQIDTDAAAIGRHQSVEAGIVGEVGTVAERARAVLARRPRPAGAVGAGYRTVELLDRLERGRSWRDVPYTDLGDGTHIDPRTLTIALNRILPPARVLAVDSGNFMGYPMAFLDVPDADGCCFTQAFQSVGLGLATAIGAAVAHPERVTIAALGDGGFLMGISELETAVRRGLDMVIVVYNDGGYGAETHHFGPGGFPLTTVIHGDVDLAAIGRGFGCEAVTVGNETDLTAVSDWVAGARQVPLVIDAKVSAGEPSWWLEEAFRGH